MRLNDVWLVGLLACLALTRGVVCCSWTYNETAAMDLADGNRVEVLVSFNQVASAADGLFLLPLLARSLFDSLNVSRLSLTVAQGLGVQESRSSRRRIWPTGATAYVELASGPGGNARQTPLLQELSAVLSSLSCVPQTSWQSAWTPLRSRQSSNLFFDREISADLVPVPSRGFLAQAADEPACVEHLLRWQALLPCGLRAGAAKLLPALLRPSQHRGLAVELSAGPSGARVDVAASFVLGREQAEEALRARSQEPALECMGSRVQWDLEAGVAARDERARAFERLAEESEMEHLERLLGLGRGEDRQEGGANGSGDREHLEEQAQTSSSSSSVTPPSLRLHRRVETHSQKQAWDGRCVLRAEMDASAASDERNHLLHIAMSFPKFVSIERLDVAFDGQRLQRGDPRLLSVHVHEEENPAAHGADGAKISIAEVTLAWNATRRLAASGSELRVDLIAYFTMSVHSIFDLPPDAARGALIPPALASWGRFWR
ncbi:hypothetical protein H632_c83p3 [Helicosporidium sp. ATCC 50920]|nr:hypothetical protein H632_c83p3 [Helicosporidium sp. ATCC 50920]|eukprot:KDD76866.1 hypothetical protein H632_c83p3 [Helicosporidium sp. ATCC 50920]